MVTLYACVTPQRFRKTSRIMTALAQGWDSNALISYGPPPADSGMFAVWGQRWLSELIVPPALRKNRPFWHIDNGYFNPARGGPEGCYRMTYRGLCPILLSNSVERPRPEPRPWRKHGGHIVLGIPGETFGRCIGLDMQEWTRVMTGRLHKYTDRKILIRAKRCDRPLEEDLKDAWALVTHSSNVAVDAVLAGIPIFVEKTSPARWVGNSDLNDLEFPLMPERDRWLKSLSCQQFTLSEMRDGTARDFMRSIMEQVDVVS